MSLRTGEFFIYTERMCRQNGKKRKNKKNRKNRQEDDHKAAKKTAKEETHVGGSYAVCGPAEFYRVFCFGAG